MKWRPGVMAPPTVADSLLPSELRGLARLVRALPYDHPAKDVFGAIDEARDLLVCDLSGERLAWLQGELGALLIDFRADDHRSANLRSKAIGLLWAETIRDREVAPQLEQAAALKKRAAARTESARDGAYQTNASKSQKWSTRKRRIMELVREKDPKRTGNVSDLARAVLKEWQKECPDQKGPAIRTVREWITAGRK